MKMIQPKLQKAVQMVSFISPHFILLALLSALFSVEGIFILKPQSTNVTVNKLFTLKCSTSYSNYGLLFTYDTPQGYTVNNQDSSKQILPGGGTVITVTFLVTKELNTTNVTCSALDLSPAGTNYHSDPATITAYDVVPNGLNNIKVCQLDHFIFVSWDKIFAPKGISITYSISDNRGLQTVINNSSYSFFFNETSKIDYYLNITVIVIATAANQTDNSSITTLPYKLNGTIPLDLSYDKDNSSRVGTKWLLLFKVKLHHLHPSQCIIDNETLKGASVMNCQSNNNCINSTSVHYDKHNNEINSTNLLHPRKKYNSRLCFKHMGINIMSQPVQTSTHDIQDIENISPNDTSLCLCFHLIHHAQSQELHLHLWRDEISQRYNVTLPDLQNKTKFEWCASTIPATSNNNGNWSLYAYDGPGHTNPAIVLENIILNITEAINTATTYNTIVSTDTTTYTTHTTTMTNTMTNTMTTTTTITNTMTTTTTITTTSLSHALYYTSISSIVSSSSPSPNSTVTATLPSNSINPWIIVVLVLVPVVIIIVTVIVCVVAKWIRNKKMEVV